jgi:hypothetical protein
MRSGDVRSLTSPGTGQTAQPPTSAAGTDGDFLDDHAAEILPGHAGSQALIPCLDGPGQNLSFLPV